MPGPVLIVHDAPETVHAIERMLASIGRASVVASTVEDAIATARAQAVSLVLLWPGVESGRGHVVLEELPRVPFVLLGEAAAGFDFPVAPLPPDESLLDLVLQPGRDAVLAAAEQAMATARASAQVERDRVSQLEQHLNDLELKLAMREADNARLTRELDSETRARGALTQAKAKVETSLAVVKGELDAAKSESTAERTRAESDRASMQEKLDAAMKLLDDVRTDAAIAARVASDKHVALQAGHDALNERVDAVTAEWDALLAERIRSQDEAVALRARIETLEVALAQAAADLDSTVSERNSAQSNLHDVEHRAQSLQHTLAETEARAQRSDEHVQRLAGRTEQLQRTLDTQLVETGTAQARAESAERQLAEAQERIKRLEHRVVLHAAAPERPAIAVPKSGTLGLTELSRLIAQLASAQADVRVDLTTLAGTRTLWLARGMLMAAASSLRRETIVERARSDGLIDKRAEVDGESFARQLDALVRRGLVRRSEVEALVQRYVEGIALEALSEADCTYTLLDDAVPASAAVAATRRAMAPLIAQGLRRGLPPDAHLAIAGGAAAAPRFTASRLEAEAMGLSERESRMLSRADGQTRIEGLAAAAGLSTERAWQAFAIAKVLGLTQSGQGTAGPAGDETARLEQKYEQVQNADYFAILGLPPSADADAVRRAQLELSQQFDPLRFAGHDDPAVLQRAQIVYRHVKDAAQALHDDRRRAEYARHLKEQS